MDINDSSRRPGQGSTRVWIRWGGTRRLPESLSLLAVDFNCFLLSYKNAKSIRRQFERIWRKKKTPINRARLRKQIARCNSLANKDKATYFRALVKENGDDPKKLWQVLRSALHRIPDKLIPSNSSQKQLADQFAAFSLTRSLKSESLFPVLHPFPCHLL